MKIAFVSIPNPQFNWGGLRNERVSFDEFIMFLFFSLCLCAFVVKAIFI